MGLIINYHSEGPFLDPEASILYQFLKILAGLYVSLKYAHTLYLSPWNWMALGDSETGNAIDSTIELLTAGY